MRVLEGPQDAPPVFNGYSQAQLDAQYDNQAACPDFRSTLDAGAALSRKASGLAGERGVRWGRDGRESLDIYREASGPGLLPVVVYVHGGGWLILDKESSAFGARSFGAAGCLFVALGFHTAATVPFAEMVERVREGVAWIAQNIQRYGGDPERIVLVGHSSGTHLVSQCLTHDWASRGLPSTPIAGAILVSGLGDLHPVRLSYRNQRLELSQEHVQRYSLLRNPLTVRCPVDVVVAEHDTDEFKRQAADMAGYLERAGLLRHHYMRQGAHHFDVILDLADSDSRLFGETLSLASAHSGKPSGFWGKA